nr:non-structural polyprotein 1ab [Bovine astrovirus CH13/NeuroS1]
MALSYCPKGTRVLDTYDSVLQFGSKRARQRGLALDKVARNHLGDLFPDGGPLAFGFGPLDMIDPTGDQPKLHNIDTVYVAGVVAGNEYIVYQFIPGLNEWRETDATIHKPTALVGTLVQEHKRLSKEVQDLKRELSQQKMDFEILRHDYERVRPVSTSPATRPFNLLTVLLYAFLFGLLAAGLASGQRTGTCYSYDEASQSCLYWEWHEVAQPDWPKFLTDYFKDHWQVLVDYCTMDVMVQLAALVYQLFNWYACAGVVAVIYALRSENPIYMLITLIMATLSHYQMFALAVVPALDFTATISLWAVMAAYALAQSFAILLSFALLVMAVLAGLFLNDAEYAIMVKAHFYVFLATCTSHVVEILHLPFWAVASVLVTYRLYRSLSFTLGERYEVRSADGKILTTVSSQPNWLARVSRFAQSFRQRIRTSVAPTARIIPNALVTVESKEGSGTGFRVQSHLVTAGHVVAGDEQVKVTWGHVVVYAKVVYRHPTKDLAFLTLPAELQQLPAYKFAKNPADGPVVLTAFDEASLLLVAVTEAVLVDNHWTYAVATRNGMSGAPLTNVDGRLLGVHLTNTGFTGGAIVIVPDDLPDTRKPTARELELEARIKELEAKSCGGKPLLQSRVDADAVVELIRVALQREMSILRKEIDDSLAGYSQKKKGKKNRKKCVWTEEEYRALLEKGFTRDQLREMADALREQTLYGDEDDDEAEVEVGYPEWSDPDQDSDIDAEWFGSYEQSWRYIEPQQSEELVNTLPSHLTLKYSLDNYPISKSDIQAVAKEMKQYEEKVSSLISESVDDSGNWKKDVDGKKILQELDALWFGINHTLWDHGLMPFTQRRKRVTKPKLQRGPEEPGPAECTLRYWQTLLEPTEPFLIPSGYPVVGKVPLDRPISDRDEPIDDLLSLLPNYDEDLTAFSPATWGPAAYEKSFEKFTYKEPTQNIAHKYPREWRFATRVLGREFDFLADSVVKDITAVSKNSESTPAYPKTLWWKTEADYLAERGYSDYISEWNRLVNDSSYRPDVLWYLFLKKEILKTDKILDDDIRQILCADPIFARIGCCFEEDQNDRMKRRTRTRMPQCGWSPFFGGFHERVSRLAAKGNPHWVEFDWTRYDGTIPEEVFRHIKNFRFNSLASRFKTPELRSVYEWYVDNIIHRKVCLPTGEVTEQHRGNPSGQVSTTMDNNMFNVFFQAFEYAYLRPHLTDDELCQHWDKYDSLIYGDDRLNTCLDLPSDYVCRVIDMYATIFGMWVKPDKVKVSAVPQGLSFCGFTITLDTQGFYVPVPTETKKLAAALLKPTKKLDGIASLYGKLLCYRILSHNLPNDNKFKNYILLALEVLARHFVARGEEPPFYVTEEMLDKLWRGGPKRDYG